MADQKMINGTNPSETHKQDTGTTPEAYSLDTLLKNLGHCGRFQVIFTALGYFPLLPGIWSLMFMTFGSYAPEWTCHDLSPFNKSRVQEYFVNVTAASIEGPNRIKTFASVCDKMRACENGSFDSAVSTIATEWSLVCDKSWILSLIGSVQMAAIALGSYVAGQVGDKLGRKYNIHGGAAILALTNIIAIFSVSWKMYVVINFFIGFVCGMILSTAAVYNVEYLSAWWRGILTIFPYWNIGTFTFGLVCFALKNWRHVHIATAFFSLLAFLSVFWVPESLRFLAVHGKLSKAHKVVRTIARLNRKPAPDTTIINKVAEQEKENMRNRTTYTYLDLFRRKLFKSTIVLGITWFTLSIGYWMIGFGLTTLSGNFFVNLLLYSTLSMPFRVIAIPLAVKIGRKFAISLSLGISSVFCFLIVALELLTSRSFKDTANVVMALGSIISIESGWGVLAIWGLEQYPTGVRNMSYAFFNAAARTGAIIAPYLLLKQSLPMFGSFLIMAVLQLICLGSLLFLSETIEKPLPDNLQKSALNIRKKTIL